MKILNNAKIVSKAFIALLTGSMLLSACSKDDDDFVAPEIAGLNVVHASPSDEELDIYVENSIIQNNPDFEFGDKIGYVNLIAGDRTVVIKKKGTSANLLSQSFKFEVQKGYTLFVGDKFDQLKYVMVKDDLSSPATGKAKVRFVNMGPDAAALNLAIAGKDTDLITDKAFKQYSDFVEIDPAAKVTFNAKDKASGEVVAALADVKIDANKIYTIWVKGLTETEDEDMELDLQIFAH